jgi:hypothetical protein
MTMWVYIWFHYTISLMPDNQMPRKITKVSVGTDVSNTSRPPLQEGHSNGRENSSWVEREPSALLTPTDPPILQPGQSNSLPAYRTFTYKFAINTKNFVKAKFIRRPDGLFNCIQDCGMIFGTKEEAQVHLDSVGRSPSDTRSHHAQSKWPK